MNLKEAYAEYLRSEHWAILRRSAIERDGGLCMICNSGKRLNVHHRRYPENWFEGTLADVVTLCNKCHKKHHGLDEEPHKPTERKPRRKRKARKNLQTIWRPGNTLSVAADDSTVTITSEIMDGLRTKNGGFSAKTLWWMGEPWPLRHGWLKRILGRKIPAYNYGRLMEMVAEKNLRSQNQSIRHGNFVDMQDGSSVYSPQ